MAAHGGLSNPRLSLSSCRKARVFCITGFQPVEGERRATLVSLSPSPFEGRLNGVQAPRRGLDKRRRGGGAAGAGPRVQNPWLDNNRPLGAEAQALPVESRVATLSSTILHNVFVSGGGTGGKTCPSRAMMATTQAAGSRLQAVGTAVKAAHPGSTCKPAACSPQPAFFIPHLAVPVPAFTLPST